MRGHLEKLNVISHEIKLSIDSVNTDGKEESVSISSCHSSMSEDSEEIHRISDKTKQITELVNSRLTAFLFMSQKCYEEGIGHPTGNDELEGLKQILCEALDNYSSNDYKKEEILVKHIFEQIICLQKEYNYMQDRLINTQAEIKETEEEENRLKEEIGYIEKNIKKFIADSHQISSSNCNCLII